MFGSLKIGLLVGGVSLLIIGLLYWQNTRLETKLEQANILLGTYKTANENLEKGFSTYRKSTNRQLKTLNSVLTDVNLKNKEARRERDELQNKMAEHDFSYLAKQKPGLVGAIINRATSRVLRQVECSTGYFSDRKSKCKDKNTKTRPNKNKVN